MFDRVLQSRRVLTPRGILAAAIVIRDGRIASVEPWGTLSGNEVVDAGDRLIMPGVIDSHVHINEPGRTDWEGFDTATRAAIAGGITTLVDMPLNASPVTTNVKAFGRKLQASREQLHCHCGFWGGIIPGNEKEIAPLAAAGVRGFKVFLTDSGIDEFPATGAADLEKAMPLIAQTGLPLLVHAELISAKASGITDTGRSYQRYLASRPTAWENAAIELMIALCEKYRCPVHIVHLSSAEAIPSLRQAREKGLPLTVETAQHYLYFTAEGIPDGQPLYKCAPPIREAANNEQLWQALSEGVIDFVATDHSPAPPSMKDPVGGDWMKAWGGIASLQLALPVLWTAARKRKHPVEMMAKWLCQGPAQLAGMQDRKGRIEQGFDADLVVWDPETRFTVSEEQILHRHRQTPYRGETLYGTVSQTWLGGILVYDEGRFLLKQGQTILHIP